MSSGIDDDLPVRDGLLEVDQKDAESATLIGQLIIWRRPGQQQQQVAVLRARDEDLAAINDVEVALPNGFRLDPCGLRSGVRLRDAECLKPQFAAGDAWQVGLLLLV